MDKINSGSLCSARKVLSLAVTIVRDTKAKSGRAVSICSPFLYPCDINNTTVGLVNLVILVADLDQHMQPSGLQLFILLESKDERKENCLCLWRIHRDIPRKWQWTDHWMLVHNVMTSGAGLCLGGRAYQGGLTEDVTPGHYSNSSGTGERQPPFPTQHIGTRFCVQKTTPVPREKFWVHLDSQAPIWVSRVKVWIRVLSGKLPPGSAPVRKIHQKAETSV